MTKNLQNARETLEQMYLERDEMGDVTFLVEDQRIRAHRNVLATQSPKYRAQFYGPHRDEGAIRVPYVSAAAFNVFLEFFYKKVVGLTMDNIEMVMDLAQQSLVETFVGTCVQFLNDAIKANKVCIPYRLATVYDIEPLRLECEQQITKNTMDVFASEDFLHCDRDALLQILKMDVLNCEEKDVLAACFAWARAQCKKNNTDDAKPANLRAALGDAIYQIRFSAFNPEEFAALYKSMKGFFTADDTSELLCITAKLKGSKSQNFNETARTSLSLKTFDERKTVWSLEIDRFERKNDKQSFESVGIGRVKIESHHPIKLYGIALGVRFDQADEDKFPEMLTIQTDGGFLGQTRVMRKYKIFQSPTRHDETIIVFEKPIEQLTSFSSDFSQLPAKQVNYDLSLKRFVREFGVDFTFYSKWVTRVFCNESSRFR